MLKLLPVKVGTIFETQCIVFSVYDGFDADISS